MAEVAGSIPAGSIGIGDEFRASRPSEESMTDRLLRFRCEPGACAQAVRAFMLTARGPTRPDA
jgi:hypothetical protein